MTGDTPVESRLLTESEAADRLLITRRRLQEICREGQIGFVQISPRVRGFTERQVAEYVVRKTAAPRSGKPAGSKVPVDRGKASRLSSRKRSVNMKGGEGQGSGKLVKDSDASLTKEIRELCQ